MDNPIDKLVSIGEPLLSFIEEKWYWILGIAVIGFMYFIIRGLRIW